MDIADDRAAAPIWHVRVFIVHADYMSKGHKLPEGWEPMSIEQCPGNRFAVMARKHEAKS